MNKRFLGTTLSIIFLSCALFIRAAGQGSIIINEIAWMGNANSVNDEWIELFNHTSSPIDLYGWKIASSDGKLTISLSGIVAPKGFYLLERTDDNSASTVAADLIYKGALSNNGMNLGLYDGAGNVIDQANYAGKWPAGDNETKQTMEKAESGWQTSREPGGTPKKENSTVVNASMAIQSPAANEAPPDLNQNTIPAIESPAPIAQESITAFSYPEGLIINELLPSPDGPDETEEWIEIYNNNDFEIILFDWSIQDKSGDKYIFPKESKISAKGYVALARPKTKIILNNDSDVVNLHFPNGKIASSVSYENAPTGRSYNAIKSGWQWSSTATPGSENIIIDPAASLSKAGKNDTTSNRGTAAASQSEIVKKLFSQPLSEKNNSSIQPWQLFFIALAIAIICAGIMLAIKFIALKKSISNERT